MKEETTVIDQIFEIGNFILNAFWHIWPYLLVTIPLAVAVQMSGASRHISRAFQARPVIAIFLATAVGAFSPFCSCSVIPVIAALLIGGVPLAPVMSFWIASPSMDPEIFFLSVATLGWELAVWRLGATLVLSLSAGFITHIIVQRGWLGQQILRQQPATSAQSTWSFLKSGWRKVKDGLSLLPKSGFVAGRTLQTSGVACCSSAAEITLADTREPAPRPAPSCGATAAQEGSCSIRPASFQRRLLGETWSATLMVAKFMALAFFLEALITLYVPSEWIAGLLGPDNPWAIVTAALIGVPVYTSNLAALAMVGGLLTQGMNPAAALAFLVSGPTTTIPAMAAVWGLTSRRVFVLYVAFSLLGAVALGYLYGLVLALP
jgi:uncharacterized membrane protein YraQ (UPF0718 family)